MNEAGCSVPSPTATLHSPSITNSENISARYILHPGPSLTSVIIRGARSPSQQTRSSLRTPRLTMVCASDDPPYAMCPFMPFTEKRYTCVHQSCVPPEGMEPTYYSTWSALQHHTRTAHPPTCPYPSCNGKTFTQQKGLRAHLKIHAQRDQEADIDDAIHGSASENEDEPPRKRRRGGEVGRDWVCKVDGCGKDFKSVILRLLRPRIGQC